MKNVKGKEDFPLTLSWLSGQPPEEPLADSNTGVTTPSDMNTPSFQQTQV